MIRSSFANCTLIVCLVGWAIFPAAALRAQGPLSLLPPTQGAPPPLPPAAVPQQPQPQPGGEWIDESAWWPMFGWDGSVELGLTGSSGNTDTFNLRAAGNAVRKTEANVLKLDLSYNQATDKGLNTKNNAQFNEMDEILFGDSPWTLFQKLGLEYDQFKAFDYRLTLNGGVGYRFIKNDVTTFTGRFGAGVSHEFGGPTDEWKPEADFGLELEHQLSKQQKLTAKVDYYPTFDNFDDYRVVGDVAWVIALDSPQNLSLKVGVNDQYQSVANGKEPNDLNYSATLLWKF